MDTRPRRLWRTRSAFVAVAGTVVAAAVLTAPPQLASAVVGERVTFNNLAPIQFGPARGSRFVSSLEVSGQPIKLEDVNVTLHGFHAPSSADVDVLLESPSGTRVMIMSDAIGISNGCALSSGVYDLTFDDAASGRMFNTWKSGTFKPSNFNTCEGGDSFVPAANGETLSLFNGQNPNGVWKLYLSDDSDWMPDANEIQGGWSLNLGYPAPPIASGDIQIGGPENSAFHNRTSCAVTTDGGTIKYPIKVTNTGGAPAQFRLKTQSPALLYATPYTTTALPQETLGYLTPALAPGSTATFTVKIKLPTGTGFSGARAGVTISDTNGTYLDGVGACAMEAAGAATTSSDLLVKSGYQQQVSGTFGPAVTGKTLIPGGAATTFAVTLKNRTAVTKPLSLLLDGAGSAESPDCDNIVLTVKVGGVDVTSAVLDKMYMTPPTVRGGTRTFNITVKATGPKSADRRTCDWDYWYIWSEGSEVFAEVNLAAPKAS